MNPKETRLGNLVEYKNDVLSISTIGETTFSAFKDGSRVAFMHSDAKPIPLTKEWLLKFGFEEKGIGYSKGFIYLWHYDDGIFLELFSDSNSHNTALKYLHQIQNLYFALTGQELTTVEDAVLSSTN